MAEASDWLCRAFGFTERLRIGDHRAQLVIGDGAVILTAGRTDRHHWTFAQSIADVDPAAWGAIARE